MSPVRILSRCSRVIILTCIPIASLALGWNLGAEFERSMLASREQELSQLFTGGTGSGQVIGDPEQEVDLSLMWSVWRLLQQHYIEPNNLQRQSMIFGAVQGMVGAVGDPYTTFMTPDENKEFHDSLDGHLQGIGAELALRNARIIIVAPLKGSPAEKAGLLPEDAVLGVDGWSTEGQSLNDVVSKIRGRKGTKVSLLILHPGSLEPVTVDIVRDDIVIPSVRSTVQQTESGAIAVVEINQFGSETTVEVREALRKLAATDLKGLIIDLRNNGGGYLNGAVDISSMFLSSGKVVSVERRDGEPQRHYVDGRPILPSLPLVVLINEATASASEILAGALQDHGRATIVGAKSFGKGTVQEVIDLPGGGSLRVTAARWLTPNGRNLGKEGVTPDVVVERTRQDIETGKDPQMEKAQSLLFSGLPARSDDAQ